MRVRPKSDYMHTASLESLYALNEHWQSDLYFYKDEIRFLNDLIAKYFIWMTKEMNIAAIRQMSTDLMRIESAFNDLSNRVEEHRERMELLIENPFSHDEQTFRNEHEKLEDDIEESAYKFRILKKGIFTITDHVIENERIQHLLTS